MSNTWESRLDRWTAAGVIDGGVRERILAWEAEQPERQGMRWPVWIALAFGVILLGAGVLLFVSARWDQLSSGARMTLVTSMVMAFHAAGALTARRFAAMSIAMHTVGTLALGGAIALAGQIFNLSEHWPTGALLWAVGAALAWALLRHWTQAALAAILVPYWLAGEWWTYCADNHTNFTLPISVGVCALSFAYLSGRRGPDDSLLRKALGWVGGLALVPAVLAIAVAPWNQVPAWEAQVLAWGIAGLAPLALAIALRRDEAIWVGGGILWALLLVAANGGSGGGLAVYFWCVAGCAGMVLWGTHDSRSERINLGVVGLALTVLMFYFDNVMNKLDRAAGLIVVGLLFLGGGWLLERMRRHLIAQFRMEAL